MASKKQHKLQLLVSEAPPKVVLTSSWLKKHGISLKLAWWYAKSGWLEHVAGAAYKRQGDTVTWMGALSALQYQLGLPLYVGGKTALQLLGRAHYVPVGGIKSVELYRNKRFTIPQWFKNADWQVNVTVRMISLFAGEKADGLAILEREFDNVALKLSAPERAIMEVLYHIPRFNTFDEAGLLMENLAQLRPKVMQKLLQSCSSIKTKRLLLFFAEKFDHPWLKELDLASIELGSGKIKIDEGGQYISKYKISVPRKEEDEYEF